MLKKLLLAVCLIGMVAAIPACAQKPQRQRAQKPRVNNSAAADSLAVLKQKIKEGDAEAMYQLGVCYQTGKYVKADSSMAMRWWTTAAEKKHPRATGMLAQSIRTGYGLPKADSLLSAKMYKKAISLKDMESVRQLQAQADKGDVFACKLLRECYNNGIGVKQDMKQAMTYVETMARAGDTESQYELALYLHNHDNVEKAAMWYKRLADKGHPGGTYYYGRLLFEGDGVTRDKAKGVEYLQRASEMGMKTADYQLAAIYMKGDGVEKNEAKGIAYLRSAAYDTYPKRQATRRKAQWQLAGYYQQGVGLTQDYYTAAQWYAEAYKGNEKQFAKLMKDEKNAAFRQYLGCLRTWRMGKDPQAAVSKLDGLAKVCRADADVLKAQIYLDDSYAKKNDKKAARMLVKYQDTMPWAAYTLSTLYQEGRGVKKDEEKALELLRKAADMECYAAQLDLAARYMNGDGVKANAQQAAALLLNVEGQNQLTPEAAALLAECYQKKVPVLPDLDQAEARIKALKQVQANGKLVTLLDAIAE